MATAKFASYTEASRHAHRNMLINKAQWMGQKNRPANLPYEPWKTYGAEFHADDFFPKVHASSNGVAETPKKKEEPIEAPKKKEAAEEKNEKAPAEPAVLPYMQHEVISLDQVAKMHPAVKCNEKHPKLSERYNQVSTYKVIQNIQKVDSNWQIVQARSTNMRKEELRKFTHHVVKLENDTLPLGREGKIQIVISNSHNGVSKFEFFLGIFVKVCSNGLIVKHPMFEGINKKHFTDYEEINAYIVEMISHVKEVRRLHNKMLERKLTDKEKADLVIKGLHSRYQYKNSYLELAYPTLKERYDIKGILKPLRTEDEGDDLWHVFNTIQERVTRGEYFTKNDYGSSKANPIKNTHCDLQFNKTFWGYAMELIDEAELVEEEAA